MAVVPTGEVDADRLRRLLEAEELSAAFELLYRAHHKDVATFVRGRVASAAQADDVCQDVWSAVSKALPRFRFEAQPRVWVLSIARNKSLDVWRRQTNYDTLDSQLVQGGALASMIGARRVETPTVQVQRKQRGAALRHALSQLRPEDREMLELRFVMGMKPAEIAQVLGSTMEPNTVSQRLVRILRRVRQHLDDE